MVSNRCKMVVKQALNEMGLHFVFVELGELDVMEDLDPTQFDTLRSKLHDSGLEVMDDKKSILIEKIKTTVIEMVHHSNMFLKVNFSSYLSQKLNLNYAYLAGLFSEVQGLTIEQFMILHKIERIKELIIYDEMNISEIADSMNYSSVAHLSNQFKKSTGLSPTHFKKLLIKRRNPLEEIGRSENELKLETANG